MGNLCQKTYHVPIYISNLNNFSKQIKMDVFVLDEKVQSKIFSENSIMDSMNILPGVNKLCFYYKEGENYIYFQEIFGPFSENEIINLNKINSENTLTL